jgi:hypothetical protein
MQRHAHAIHTDGLSVIKSLYRALRADARTQYSLAGPRRQIRSRARAGMIRMRMRDDGAIHRPPRIHVEIAARAVKSAVSQFKNDSSIG